MHMTREEGVVDRRKEELKNDSCLDQERGRPLSLAALFRKSRVPLRDTLEIGIDSGHWRGHGCSSAYDFIKWGACHRHRSGHATPELDSSDPLQSPVSLKSPPQSPPSSP